MAVTVTLGGVNYSVPEDGDTGWGPNLTAYLEALAVAFPQVGTGSTGYGVFAEAYTTAGQSITNNTWTGVVYGTEVTDTDSAYNPATGVFTVPSNKSGRYSVHATVRFTGLTANTGTIAIAIYKNGVEYADGGLSVAGNGTGQVYQVNHDLNLVAGDTVAIYVFQNQGGSRSLDTTATSNRLNITRLP